MSFFNIPFVFIQRQGNVFVSNNWLISLSPILKDDHDELGGSAVRAMGTR